MNRPWGCPGGDKCLFKYIAAEHRHRLGHCNWIPEDGDLCVRVRHSGDAFHTYAAIRKNDDGKWCKVGEFGSYVFAQPIGGPLPDREFYMIMAGEPVDLAVP